MRDEFAVRPITAGGWDYIAAALGRLLVRLAATGNAHCVIVESPRDYYVQFMVRPGDTTWSEAVGEVHLDKPYDDEKKRILLQMGWQLPDSDGRWAGNYVRESRPGEELEAAVVGVLTLVDVFDASPFDAVSVSVFEAVTVRP